MLKLSQQIKAISELCIVLTDIEPGQLVSANGDDYLILWLRTWLILYKDILESKPFDAITLKICEMTEGNVINKELCEELFQLIISYINDVSQDPRINKLL